MYSVFHVPVETTYTLWEDVEGGRMGEGEEGT